MFTFGIDDNQSVATLYDEDGGAALTLTTIPLTDIDRFPATRVIPAPGVSDDDALKQIAEALLSFLNMNSFIHIDPSDVLQACTSATVHVVRFRAENDANKAFSDALALQSINPTRCDGALVNIDALNDILLSTASSLVDVVRDAIQPDAQIIWGMALDSQRDDIIVTAILAKKEEL